MLGFPEGYRGEGITYRYLQFKQDGLDITVGNFYEQFGTGMVFRSYEERGLGYDNAMDGVRIKVNPVSGLSLKAVMGRQRFYFEKSPGLLRGIDFLALARAFFSFTSGPLSIDAPNEGTLVSSF